MRTVTVSDLQSRLLEHLQVAKKGEEVTICEDDDPVARIVPCVGYDRSEQTRRLIAHGVLAPPLRARPIPEVLPPPVGSVSDEVMSQLWREERGEK